MTARNGQKRARDPRQPWQIAQGLACGCRGTDDMCPCQNVTNAENLSDQLAAAEARVVTLKRQIAGATCAEAGHDWQHIGGKNAGCGDDCACSVPVHVCSKCGDSDYGDNDEAATKRDRCREDRSERAR